MVDAASRGHAVKGVAHHGRGEAMSDQIEVSGLKVWIATRFFKTRRTTEHEDIVARRLNNGVNWMFTSLVYRVVVKRLSVGTYYLKVVLTLLSVGIQLYVCFIHIRLLFVATIRHVYHIS